ncbi:MAG TPA: M1 family metallopeptidase, partial [Thermoanaerobaculia bacterium]|nr:M1 family metallopeptidase [Thermoanaerobaculia bacterium]
PLLAAIRLPVNVLPEHYAIRIAPELGPETFSGEETIDVRVSEPVSSITMHAVDLNLTEVMVDGAPAEVVTDKENETVALKLAQPLQPGAAKISIRFDGKLGQQLRGLYLSKTATYKYAVTQFEAMSARRAFPCFDEPAMKATFDVTLVVDAGDSAISNGRLVFDQPVGNRKHALTFARTPKLPTYLLAFLIGRFQCISSQAEGTPIRVCTTPGLQHLGKFALEASKASLRYFNDYYGIRYPFEKLDLIGIPDFAAGAMENAGAITFRETDLLVDEQSSVLARKRVALVVGHEIAHMWFGDLVTMKWWNDIWLNEGFATFMSTKPLEAWKPEWRTELDMPVETDDALTTDSQRSTRPIRLPVTTESSGLFDSGIVYGKTASVLRMVEEWVGPDAFRDAIRVYLKKYSWSNAAAEDFWATIRGSAKQPIDVVLQSFVDVTGAPLLRVSETCTVTQERLLPKTEAPVKQAWTIPICASGTTGCQVISGDAALPSCGRYLSRAGASYYVVDYPAATRAAFRTKLQTFPAAERISYRGNEWILVRTMHREAGEYLGLLRALPRTAERQLVTETVDSLVYLGQRLVDDHNRDAWRAYVRDAVRGLAPATWDAPKGETSEQRIARAYVLWAVGYLAADPDVIAGARRTAEQYMKDPTSVDALIGDRALRISAVYGDEAFLTRVTEELGRAATPEIAARYRNLLPFFRDPKAVGRAYEYIYGDRIRTQDLPAVASAGFADPATRAAAWSAAKLHWAEVEQKATGAVGRIAFAAGAFCDPASRAEVEQFFKEHPPRNGTRGVTRALDAIDTCIAFKAAQQASFDAALGK